MSTSLTQAEQLDDIVVTATRTEQLLSDTLAPISVVNRQTIERLQVTNLSQLLDRLPGMDSIQRGGAGSNASLFLRGTSSKQALVLIDGQRFGSATLGQASIQFINPAQIEQIEVLKGSRSSLYGSDAIGGVINIITRKAPRSAAAFTSASVQVGLGSQDSTDHAFSFALSANGVAFSISGTQQQTNEFDRQVTDVNLNDDDDAYRNAGVNLGLTRDLGELGSIGLTYLRNEGQSEFDNRFCSVDCLPTSDFEIECYALFGNIVLSDFWQLQFNLGQSVDKNDNADDTVSVAETTSVFETQRRNFSLQNDFNLLESTVFSLGYEFYEDDVGSSSRVYRTDPDDPDSAAIESRDNKAGYIQLQTEFSNQSIVVGGRFEDNEQFGSHETASLDYGIHFSDSLTLVASWGLGFNTPTFNDLFWPLSFGSRGNPDLKPEELENVELSLKGHFTHLNWQVTAYRNDIDNLIEWIDLSTLTPAGVGWQPRNVNAVDIEGIEFNLGFELDAWHINASYSLVDAVDADSDLQLQDRAKRLGSIDVDRRFGQLDLGFSIRVIRVDLTMLLKARELPAMPSWV